MAKKRDPFNVQLINPEKSRLAGLLPVQSMDIFDNEGNYHPQGLYSTEIFGKPGEKIRMTKHGFIDMRTEILHPKIYLELVRVKNLYSGILEGKVYAVWNNEIKDFEKSDILDGKTGYAFFMEHFYDINFHKNESIKREQRLMLIEKYKNNCLYRYLIVLPAGLRDITVEDDGRVIEDDINTLYRKVMRVSNTIAVRNQNSNDPTLDTARWSLQKSFNEIYDYIQTIVEGKKGFLLGKWGTRVIHGGTRNVITAMDTAPAVLGQEGMINIYDTMVGLHQYMKGCIPVVINNLKNGYWGNVIKELPGNISVYDKKTYQKVSITPSGRTKEKWGTADGIEDLINGFEDSSIRHNFVTIDGNYLGLIYIDDKYFKVIDDISTLPEGFNREFIRPITWAELYYFSVYWRSKELIGYVTRYPILGPGSIYPCNLYLKVTDHGLRREELDQEWKPSGKVWNEIPGYLSTFFDSMSPHSVALDFLGADFDGDKTSLNIVYSENAIKEGKDFLNSKEFFISPMGGLNYGLGRSRNKIPTYVLHNFTSGLEVTE